MTKNSAPNMSENSRENAAAGWPESGSTIEAAEKPPEVSSRVPATSKAVNSSWVSMPSARPTATCDVAATTNGPSSPGTCSSGTSGVQNSASAKATASRPMRDTPLADRTGAVTTHAPVRASTRRNA